MPQEPLDYETPPSPISYRLTATVIWRLIAFFVATIAFFLLLKFGWVMR